MDDIVALAMQKWPNVPDVYGWLSLDRRGNWLLRGERIGNAALNAFIARNYDCDRAGRWHFQNGPQRVFVALAATPYVYSLHRQAAVIAVAAHTGAVAQAVSAVWLVSDGSMLLETELGPGLVRDGDLAILLDAAQDATGGPLTEDALLAMQRGEARGILIDFGRTSLGLQLAVAAELAAKFHFDADPRPTPDTTA